MYAIRSYYAYAAQEIALWMLGSLANVSRNELWLLLPGTLAGWLLVWRQGRYLDLLTLGEETAGSMGADLPGLRRRLFLAVALAVGSTVAITGSIGFIGLVVPHLRITSYNVCYTKLLRGIQKFRH